MSNSNRNQRQNQTQLEGANANQSANQRANQSVNPNSLDSINNLGNNLSNQPGTNQLSNNQTRDLYGNQPDTLNTLGSNTGIQNNRRNNARNNLSRNNSGNNLSRNNNRQNKNNLNNLNNLDKLSNNELNNLEKNLNDEDLLANDLTNAEKNNLENALKNSNLNNDEIEELEKELENKNRENNQNRINKAKVAVSGMFNSAANTVGEYSEAVTGNETLMLVLKIVLGAILLIILINIIKYFYIRWETNQNGSPILVDGTKNAKQAMVISQDPQHTNYVPIRRSIDQNGIEFSYAFWFLISDFSYKQGEWKHIFHKGNSSSYPNRAPGVWIHPNANIVRIYMNTMKNILEYVDIDNIPVRKWVHMVIVVKNRHLQVYVNGFLKIKVELPSLPRQNYGNVWVNMYGGYEGYLSKLQYFDRAIGGQDIDYLVTQGPGSGNCIDTKEKPPYLEDAWWTN